MLFDQIILLDHTRNEIDQFGANCIDIILREKHLDLQFDLVD